MKKSLVLRIAVSVFLLFLITPAGFAQFSADSPVGVSAGFVKLFGTINAFSARADVQVQDTNRMEVLRTPMNFALLTGKIRMDFDMSQMQGQAVQPVVVKALKNAGLDKVASILRLDKRTIHLVFPGNRSYVNMEMSPADVEAAQKNVQVQKTALGQEMVDNHPCTKNRVVIKNAKGVALFEGLTWNASDMTNFPVRISVQTKEGTTVMHFTQVVMTPPAATQFDVPGGYTRYASTDALFLAIAQKQNAPPKAATNSKTTSPQKPVSPATPAATSKPKSASGPATKK
jgi:hypothetical protein